MSDPSIFAEQLKRMGEDPGFIAALDQSGGSTPKALRLYGVDESAYGSDAEMFDLVHAMRTRIITNPAFEAKRILAAILFEDTMNRTIEGQPTSRYLWFTKGIVPILKIDKGLADEDRGVQMMKDIPGLVETLERAKSLDVFGTKMRSVIKSAHAEGIGAVVAQQFQIADQIRAQGLVPIIEPEVDINSADKGDCEVLLRQGLLDHLDALTGDLPVMLKLTLPDEADFYAPCRDHPKVLRVAALSGGYTRAVADEKLAGNPGMIASFSRALTEGLRADQSEAEFTELLGTSIAEIAAASGT